MKLREDQETPLADQLSEDLKAQLLVSLRREGRAGALDDDALRAEIQRIWEIAGAACFSTPYQKARLVELMFALSDEHRRSSLCGDVIRGVLAAIHVEDVVRMNFLFKHVLPRRSWSDVT